MRVVLHRSKHALYKTGLFITLTTQMGTDLHKLAVWLQVIMGVWSIFVSDVTLVLNPIIN